MSEQVFENEFSETPSPIGETFSATDESTGQAAAEQTAPAAADKAPLTREQEKKLAKKYLLFAGIALAIVYSAQILHVFDFIWSKIYYGNLNMVFFYIVSAVYLVPMIFVFRHFIIKHCGYSLFHKGESPLSLKRSVIIYACAFVPIMIVSAFLGFQVKIAVELGRRVTVMDLIANACTYGIGAIKLIYAVFIIELVQSAGNILYRGKYADIIPWGGIALAFTFGLLEILVGALSGIYTHFLLLYFAFDILYGVIYLLSKKSFPICYFVSLIIFIL